MKTIYATFRNADMTEGRGPMVLDECFARQSDAETFVNGQTGVMGRGGPFVGERSTTTGDWQVKELKVYESLAEYDKLHVNAIRERALNKLSYDERKALGLK
jgi:hypothetical protein